MGWGAFAAECPEGGAEAVVVDGRFWWDGIAGFRSWHLVRYGDSLPFTGRFSEPVCEKQRLGALAAKAAAGYYADVVAAEVETVHEQALGGRRG